MWAFEGQELFLLQVTSMVQWSSSTQRNLKWNNSNMVRDKDSGVGTTGSVGSADPPLFGARGRVGSGPPYFR